jgi:hypothetical protein
LTGSVVWVNLANRTESSLIKGHVKRAKREGFFNLPRLAQRLGGRHAVLVGIGVEPRKISFGMVLTVIEAVFEELDGCAIMAMREWIDHKWR